MRNIKQGETVFGLLDDHECFRLKIERVTSSGTAECISSPEEGSSDDPGIVLNTDTLVPRELIDRMHYYKNGILNKVHLLLDKYGSDHIKLIYKDALDYNELEFSEISYLTNAELCNVSLLITSSEVGLLFPFIDIDIFRLDIDLRLNDMFIHVKQCRSIITSTVTRDIEDATSYRFQDTALTFMDFLLSTQTNVDGDFLRDSGLSTFEMDTVRIIISCMESNDGSSENKKRKRRKSNKAKILKDEGKQGLVKGKEVKILERKTDLIPGKTMVKIKHDNKEIYTDIKNLKVKKDEQQ